MNEITLFHTVEDRNNPDEVTLKGPFLCSEDDAWLGIGYYFWDSHISLGHWWGRTHYKGKYMICQAEGIIDEKCLDLLNGNDRIRFERQCKAFLTKMGKKQENVFVSEMLLLWLNLENNLFNSVRSIPTNSQGFAMKRSFRIKFTNKQEAFLDFNLPVQVCLYDKKALSLRDFRVIFPDVYVKWDFA